MGLKYCPNCGAIVKAKALLSGYGQETYKGVPVKVRKIIHLVEDGGCGFEWETLEIPSDHVPGFKKSGS